MPLVKRACNRCRGIFSSADKPGQGGIPLGWAERPKRPPSSGGVGFCRQACQVPWIVDEMEKWTCILADVHIFIGRRSAPRCVRSGVVQRGTTGSGSWVSERIRQHGPESYLVQLLLAILLVHIAIVVLKGQMYGDLSIA